jgi:hypothetical protein
MNDKPKIQPLPVPQGPFPQDAVRERIMRQPCLPKGFLGMLLVVPFLFFLVGCGDRYAEVESNTRWSGNFDGSSHDGAGNERVRMGSDSCLIVQKETASGDLRVRIVNENALFLFWDSATDWKHTSAEYGVVTLCADE